MKPRIKICGITRMEDAMAAVDAGAHALGFMFHEGSKRRIDLDLARAIIRALPPYVTRVGVFVNAEPEQVRAAIDKTGIDTLQFHGEETADYCDRFGAMKIYKAVRIQNEGSLEQLNSFPNVDAFLLDTFVAGEHGGTGRQFNWDLAARASGLSAPIILAGGLNPGNIRGAVEHVRPYAVDVSSGVESSPGIKDPAKIAEFIRAASLAGG